MLKLSQLVVAANTHFLQYRNPSLHIWVTLHYVEQKVYVLLYYATYNKKVHGLTEFDLTSSGRDLFRVGKGQQKN